MSRSRPQGNLSNPSTRWFEWDGVNGYFSYFKKGDKEKNEEGVNVTVPLPFAFIVLDELHCIAGFSEPDNTAYISNAVRNINTDKLVVKLRKTKRIVAEGLYRDPSVQQVLSKGAKYAKSVYIAFKDGDGQFQLGHILMVGSTVSAWIEFRKTINVEGDGAVVVSGYVDKTKGRNDYREVVFDWKEGLPEAIADQAAKLDDVLQNYLDSYLKQDHATSERAVAAGAGEEDYRTARDRELNAPLESGHDPDEEAHFNNKLQEAPFHDDDIPF